MDTFNDQPPFFDKWTSETTEIHITNDMTVSGSKPLMYLTELEDNGKNEVVGFIWGYLSEDDTIMNYLTDTVFSELPEHNEKIRQSMTRGLKEWPGRKVYVSEFGVVPQYREDRENHIAGRLMHLFGGEAIDQRHAPYIHWTSKRADSKVYRMVKGCGGKILYDFYPEKTDGGNAILAGDFREFLSHIPKPATTI